MSGIGAALIGGSAITGYLASGAQKDAAQKAADAQMAANQQQLAAQKENTAQALQFQKDQQARGDAIVQGQQGQTGALFAPYLAAGSGALNGLNQYGAGGLAAFNQQGAIAGSQGDAAQNAAIANIQNSPIFQALSKQGEDAILQNASATGGLRGGNVQGALGQFQPALLNQLIQQQFQNLGGLSSLGASSLNSLAGYGQGSASAQGQIGAGLAGQQLGLTGQIAGNAANIANQNTGAVTDLYGQQGTIGAGNALAQGNADANFYGGLNKSLGLIPALRAQGFLGGGGGQSSFRGALSGGGTAPGLLASATNPFGGASGYGGLGVGGFI